jgi:CMP-N-acetylneuraminic acid synthetase
MRRLERKPLIGYTLDAAKGSHHLDRVLVSTDSEEIVRYVRTRGGEAPFLRPEHLSTDTASSADVMVHALEWTQSNGDRPYDLVCLLQPTSPLRTARHLDEAISLFVDTVRAKSLVSVKRSHTNPFATKKIEKGRLVSYFPSTHGTKRRQDVPDAYVPNGAVYLVRTADFLRTESFYIDPIVPYVMDSASSVDIDEPFDLAVAGAAVAFNRKSGRQ